MMNIRSELNKARKHEFEGDSLALYAQVKILCEEISSLHGKLANIGDAWLSWKPESDGIEDGTEEGALLEKALSATIPYIRRKKGSQ